MSCPEYSNGEHPPFKSTFDPDIAMDEAISILPATRKDSGFGEEPDRQETEDDNVTKTTPTKLAENGMPPTKTSKLYHCQVVRSRPNAQPLQSSSSLPDAVHTRRSSSFSRPMDGPARSYRSMSSSRRSPRSLRRYGINEVVPPGARPHRMRSHPIMPLPHVNLEEAIALHQRSCALFRTPTSGPATMASPVPNPPPLHRSHTTPLGPTPSQAHPLEHESSAPELRTAFGDSEEEGEPPYEPYPATITHWTSNHTRRREYAEIDRRSKGLRGLLRKLMPSWCRRSSSRGGFYNEQSGEREGSVRRYRMDLPAEDEEREEGHAVDEKIAALVRGSEETNEISISEGSGSAKS